MTIHTAQTKPKESYAAVHYHGHWFWVDDRDLTTKRVFSFLMLAFTLMEPPVESIEIPFEGTVLPGYFRKAATTNAPAKTLLLLGGAETFAEELFFYIGPQALARGYNLLTVDLPGQGLLPLEGLFFRPDMLSSERILNWLDARMHP